MRFWGVLSSWDGNFCVTAVCTSPKTDSYRIQINRESRLLDPIVAYGKWSCWFRCPQLFKNPTAYVGFIPCVRRCVSYNRFIYGLVSHTVTCHPFRVFYKVNRRILSSNMKICPYSYRPWFSRSLLGDRFVMLQIKLFLVALVIEFFICLCYWLVRVTAEPQPIEICVDRFPTSKVRGNMFFFSDSMRNWAKMRPVSPCVHVLRESYSCGHVLWESFLEDVECVKGSFRIIVWSEIFSCGVEIFQIGRSFPFW